MLSLILPNLPLVDLRSNCRIKIVTRLHPVQHRIRWSCTHLSGRLKTDMYVPMRQPDDACIGLQFAPRGVLAQHPNTAAIPPTPPGATCLRNFVAQDICTKFASNYFHHNKRNSVTRSKQKRNDIRLRCWSEQCWKSSPVASNVTHQLGRGLSVRCKVVDPSKPHNPLPVRKAEWIP